MRSMCRFIALLITIAGLVGCITSVPRDNADFRYIESISEITGMYRNLGEHDGSAAEYLSALIWGEKGIENHKAIETIEVRLASNTTIVVRAYEKGRIVKETNFQQGKDFYLDSGRISLGLQTGSVGGAGSVATLGWVSSTVLGIDQHGQGKMRKTAVGGGLVFIVPIAARLREDIRFIRIGN